MLFASNPQSVPELSLNADHSFLCLLMQELGSKHYLFTTSQQKTCTFHWGSIPCLVKHALWHCAMYGETCIVVVCLTWWNMHCGSVHYVVEHAVVWQCPVDLWWNMHCGSVHCMVERAVVWQCLVATGWAANVCSLWFPALLSTSKALVTTFLIWATFNFLDSLFLRRKGRKYFVEKEAKTKRVLASWFWRSVFSALDVAAIQVKLDQTDWENSSANGTNKKT